MSSVLLKRLRLFCGDLKTRKQKPQTDVIFYFPTPRAAAYELFLALLLRRGDRIRAVLLYTLADWCLRKQRAPFLEVFGLGHHYLRPSPKGLSGYEYLWRVLEMNKRRYLHDTTS